MSETALLRNAAEAGISVDLIDQLPTGLAVLAADGQWLRANTALGALCAVDPDALTGRAAHHTHLPALAARIDDALARFPDADAALRDVVVADDRAGRHLRLSLQPLADGTALLQLHDDSALKALEAQQETLAFGISHELRAPVRAIEQFARRLLAQDGAGDPQTTRDHLQRIQQASGHAGGLIDALLETMRASRPPRGATAVDISLLGDWICAELQDAEPGRTAEIDIAPDLWAWGDEHALKQMLGKLMHNAWKFSAQRDAVCITLEGERVGNRLQLRLRDAGRGFDMRYAERLFVPFRRLHSADDGAGHGLGLAIAQQLARAQGGHIRVESEPDAGTTFFIELPAVPDEDAAAP
ncbi:ATP-binding protein [Luteimonas sp. 3794]|uniref:PAS domain-containing sensor histidine kinase n=1 Tax=Luteimonas sp. 3794 TaxID=2817730 RepID=UPI0028547AD4|nr:ATP-binding protein [Luteimonas sp. 3794]MDR6990114.1 signal transduction histidine kinase [Luteimonas sp. 3794]